MKNRIINIATVAEVAAALKELKDKIIFVGGAVVSLYVDDPSSNEIRPTADVDLAINLLNYADWAHMQERLAELGFYPNPQGHAICSYTYKGILVDIMPSKEGPIGPTNKWYEKGFDNLWTITIQGIEIKMLSVGCFLATKFEAFKDRGGDYRLSHDFEDIIYVLDNRTTIIEDIAREPLEIRDYLKEQLKIVFVKPNFNEIISAHIHPLIYEDRLPIIKEKFEKIITIR
jgi:predicted nucleotidyltransferase